MKLRDYQKEAISKIHAEFLVSDQTKAIMACGTGKSIIAIEVSREFSGIKIILAPTIVLVSQLALQVRRYTNKKVIIVSSSNIEDRDSNVFLATNSSDLKEYITEDCYIISTYSSSDVLIESLRDRGVDLIVYDEAHRTAGKFDSLFNSTITNLTANKRLFLTATERVSELVGDEEVDIFSMDNEELYGRICYELSLRDAIDVGAILDYRVLISCNTTKHILSKSKAEGYPAKFFGWLDSLLDANKNYGVEKAITYHPNVREAEDFSCFLKLYSDVFDSINHVSGYMGKDERHKALNQYSEDEVSIITNVRCLSEGVDIPNTDAVMFCSNKSSVIDIVQAMGRALRLYKGKDFGYVIVPVFDGEKGIYEDDYSTLTSVIDAINQNDKFFNKDMLRIATGAQYNSRFLELSSFIEGINVSDIWGKIHLQAIDKTIPLFSRRFEEYVKYISSGKKMSDAPKYLRRWAAGIRQSYRNGSLQSRYIDKLNETGFVWDPRVQDLKEGLRVFLEWHFANKEEKRKFPASVARRGTTYRKRYRDGALHDFEVEALREIGFDFRDVEDRDFEAGYLDVLNEFKKTGSCRTHKTFAWVKRNRDIIASDPEKIEMLKKVGMDHRFNGYDYIFRDRAMLYQQNKTSKDGVTTADVRWKDRNNKKYKNGELTDIEIEIIESLGVGFPIN